MVQGKSEGKLGLFVQIIFDYFVQYFLFGDCGQDFLGWMQQKRQGEGLSLNFIVYFRGKNISFDYLRKWNFGFFDLLWRIKRRINFIVQLKVVYFYNIYMRFVFIIFIKVFVLSRELFK